ncbi:Protein CBG27366 [Caenorhabditis briggsae]|uniref:Protein CBG27366 n=1 Tax=Caenorhabditis briggsae TaxID=6238 RepID=B6IGG6_CAEBR|nr:Protein CBG27366 [Caenorhabditis briggsae]CAR98996.1 Protein CBG27366 [Caenorhabditis briggsae]
MTQIIVMSFVNMVSAIVNAVMFYVTLRSSKNESTTYRIVSFAHNFSLFLAQLYWGLIMNPIPLLPLPGIQSIGILRGIISTFMILMTWIFLFSVSIIMMYFRDSTYSIIFFIIFAFVFFPLLSRTLPFYVSEEAMRNHLKTYYPNCLSLSDHDGFFVFVNTCQTTKGVFVVLVSLLSGAVLYLIVYAIIIHEIKMQSYAWNVNKTKNHIKNCVRFSFLAIAPAIVLRNTFLPPEKNTITITLFGNAMFTAAPIPCAIVILAQNSTYMNFLKSKMFFYNRRIPATANISSAFRSTTVL